MYNLFTMGELDKLTPVDPQKALDEVEADLPKDARLLKYGASQHGATQAEAIEAALKVFAEHKINMTPKREAPKPESK